MLIPWSTDAPLYHLPIVTVGLIVANTVAFGMMLAAEDPTPWALAFGDGLHPVQWVTNIFMHADLGHLLGNMIFLWAFGLVIEGKVGWWRFLLIYLGLGIVESALSQIGMLGGEGLALGASGAIYGLLAMALVWAPRNSLSCLLMIFIPPPAFEIPILGFVGLYLGFEIFALWMNDFQMSSAMLHLAGALPGFAVAIAMLKLDWVDCEHWDVFAVFAGREGEAVEKVAKVKPAGPSKKELKAQAAAQQEREEKRAAAVRQFEHHVQHGHGMEALALHVRLRHADSDWQLTQPQRLALVKALHQQKLWSESVAPMVEYLRHATDPAPRVRLKLAQILLVQENRPGRALDVLEKIPAGSLPPDLEQARRQIEARARKKYEEGELEIETEEW